MTPKWKPHYYGITRPKNINLKKWKRDHCRKREHLFDEVYGCSISVAGDAYRHYLVCDACGLTVYISSIETQQEARDRIKAEFEKEFKRCKKKGLKRPAAAGVLCSSVRKGLLRAQSRANRR